MQGRSSPWCPVPGALVFIVGPSAAGKSAVALELAERLNGEIVSCDAMQVYREIRVASDRPSDDMLARVPHHLVGTVSVAEDFSAARYRALASDILRDILTRGRTPVFCGGSGMYMMALLDGLLEGGGPDEVVRARLSQEAEGKGLWPLFERLRAVDPAAAEKISLNDSKRIIRALEVFEVTGMPFSAMKKMRTGIADQYAVRVFGLTRSREELYKRAEARVEAMFVRGLVDEVRGLSAKPLSLTASRLIGIPEVREFLDGVHDIERAKYLMKRNTRHYIKRQMTWFRRDERVEWVEMGNGDDPARTAEEIEGRIREGKSAVNRQSSAEGG